MTTDTQAKGKPANKPAKKAPAARKSAAERTPLRRDPVTTEPVEPTVAAPAQNGDASSNGHQPYNDGSATRTRARLDTVAVRAYLEHISKPANGPRGKRTREYIEGKIPQLEETLAAEDLDVIQRLKDTQLLKDLQAGLRELDRQADTESIEREFVSVARRYADRENIMWTTWRAMNVPAEVLKRAGIAETRAKRG
jgi:hypothetical protein